MFTVVVFFIGIVAAYFTYRAFKKRYWVGGIILALVSLFFLAGGVTTTMQENNSNSSETQSSSQKSSKSSEDDSDKAYWSSAKKAKAKSKKGIDRLNAKIGEDDRLNGLVVRLSSNDSNGTMFEVKVPDAALNGTDAQVREVLKNIDNLIAEYTGADSPIVYYYDNAGNQVAHTSLSGDIKLDK